MDKVRQENISNLYEESESSLELFKKLFFPSTKPFIPDHLYLKIIF